MRTTRLIAALPAVALAFAFVPAAQAAPSVSCDGGAIKSWLNPGLTAENREQSVRTDAYALCRGSKISRMKFVFNSTGDGSCSPMGVPNAEGSGVITWSDNSTSKFDATLKLMISGSTAEGTITDGRFAGQSVTFVGSQVHEIGDAVTACWTGSLGVMSADLVSLNVG